MRSRRCASSSTPTDRRTDRGQAARRPAAALAPGGRRDPAICAPSEHSASLRPFGRPAQRGFIPAHVQPGMESAGRTAGSRRFGTGLPPNAHGAGIWHECGGAGRTGRAGTFAQEPHAGSPPFGRHAVEARWVCNVELTTAMSMQGRTTRVRAVDGDAQRRGGRRRSAELPTGCPVSDHQATPVGAPFAAARPPSSRTRRNMAVHGVHTVMTVMTSTEEWGKIHTSNDAASREPGTPARRSTSCVKSWIDPAHGVDLT